MISEISQASTYQETIDDYFVTKIVIVGDSGVGKTNVLLRFTDSLYKHSHVATIGIDFKVKTMSLNGTKIKMQIWDTAGQERFKTITETFYKGTSGILLIFSVTNRKSFQNCRNWMKQINESSSQRTPCIIVGNKIDAMDRDVQEDEGKSLAEEWNAIYMEVSAKENLNIENVFYELGGMMIKADMHQKKKNYKMLLDKKLQTKKKCC